MNMPNAIKLTAPFVWPPHLPRLLPAPARQLLLEPPKEIRLGSFVRFKESYIKSLGGTHLYGHWSRQYGNGVGIVTKFFPSVGKRPPTVHVNFPHRKECHSIDALELARDADRAMSMLKWGPMYGPSIRLTAA